MISQLKKDIFKDSAKYVGSQYIGQLFGIVISIAMKRFLGPAMIGVWNLLQVVLGYAGYANLGTGDAAFRDIPFFKGAKDFERAERIKNEVWTFTILSSLIPAILIVFFAIFYRTTLETYIYVGLLFIAFILILQRLYEYYTTLLRANKEFTVIGQVTILSAFLNLIFTFVLVKPFKLYGLLAASYLSTLIGFIFVFFKTRYRLRFKLTREGLMHMLRVGLPLFALGLCTQTLGSMDKILIARYLGVAALGNYSIALMAGSYLLGMPNMFTITLYPRLQEKYGMEKSADKIKNYLLLPVMIIGVFVAFLIGLTSLTLPCLVYKILPAFAAGIPAMKIFIWSSFFVAIGQHAGTFLVTLNKQLKVLPIQLMGIGAIYGFGLFFIKLGWGIGGVASGVVLGSLLYNLVAIAYAQTRFARLRNFGSMLLIIFGTFFYFLAAAALTGLLGDDQSILAMFYRGAVFAALSAPAFWLLDRRTHVLSLAWTVIRGKLSPG